MNEKNKRKRQSVTVDRKWHRRLKILAAQREDKIEDLMDEALAEFLKQSAPVLRAQNEE